MSSTRLEPPASRLFDQLRLQGGSTNLVTSCCAYMISSAGMAVFNKLAVSALRLPITLVLIQMLFTVLTVAFKPRSVHIGSMRDALRWGLTVPMLFAAMLVSSMVAMQYNSLGMIVIARNVAPLFTLIIESFFRIPMQINRETVASLVTIVAGVAVYHIGSVDVTLVGMAAICLNMLFAVLERLMQRHLMAQDPVDISKPGMMLLNNLFGILPCALLLVPYGETAYWGTTFRSLSSSQWLLIFISCVNGLAISYAGLRVQQLVTATTFMVLTNVNKFLVIFFGVVVLHDPLSFRSGVGMLMAMGGGLWYGQARARLSEGVPSAGADKEKQRLMVDMESGGASSNAKHGMEMRPVRR
ncbi:hypothetical protein AB1Y20_001909 [Prymnesium parvum]|uniref:Sugar phosphate transporter domain-containing protein n=1 Tax=Prymnesium parvum TaxID=97485 RepID=A0AB34J7K2_PRYPA|mmetsp:Transcript_8946/g.19848  ORF Transcript_8946/g.19848 Transcript_8946/m.19848 type:complete len:356 (-) Transcript_8946:502-1569(-)